jgi:hypothetical protein
MLVPAHLGFPSVRFFPPFYATQSYMDKTSRCGLLSHPLPHVKLQLPPLLPIPADAVEVEGADGGDGRLQLHRHGRARGRLVALPLGVELGLDGGEFVDLGFPVVDEGADRVAP